MDDAPISARASLDLDAESRRAVRMEATAQTARVLAHEVANYLGTIRTMLYVLEDEVPRDSEAQGDLATVAQTVEAGMRFLAAIRDFVHAEPLGPDRTDLDALVLASEGAVRAALPAGATLTIRPRNAPLWVRGDAPRLARLAADLAAAAASGVTPAPGVVLEVGQEGGSPSSADAHATLTVRVRERVLDAGTLERIFEPFVADRGHEGGLRLPTVYAVVTESGGTVSAASSAAEGTSIRVALPLAESPGDGKGGAR